MEEISNKSTGSRGSIKTKEEEEQHERRRSVAKEHWRGFLEAVVTAETEKELFNSMHQASHHSTDAISDDGSSGNYSSSPQRPSFTPSEMISVASTTAMMGAGVEDSTTHVQLEELNQDLEKTANLLGDLEVEFAEDIQMLNMGLNTAFDQWGSSGQSNHSDNPMMMIMMDDMSAMTGCLQDPNDMLGTSIRSTGTGYYGDELGGPSIRSIRSHVRHLDHVKKDMENTFREAILKKGSSHHHTPNSLLGGSAANANAAAQNIALARRRRSGSVASALSVEEQIGAQQDGEKTGTENNQLEAVPDPEDVEAKFQNWFDRVWTAVEGLVERQRAQRLQLEKQQQQQRVEQHLERLENPPKPQEPEPEPQSTLTEQEDQDGRQRSSAAKIKSFWRLFMEPPPPPPPPRQQQQQQPNEDGEDDDDNVVDTTKKDTTNGGNEQQQQDNHTEEEEEEEEEEQPVYDEEVL